jgi:hypothetical protein
MARKICILADTANQFHCVGKKFPSRKLNYKAVWEMCAERGTITHAIAYCIQLGNVAAKFVTVLKRTGFDVKIRTIGEQDRFSWYPEIALDAASIAAKADEVVVLSSSQHMVPIVEHLKRLGINVHVFGCGINRDLKAVANSFTELDESALEVRHEAPVPA